MRAAVMRAGTLAVDTVPDPAPGPGQVLVRTLACGICGSDLHTLRHTERLVDVYTQSGLPVMDPTRDVVMGHEFCAEILDFGPGCTKRIPVGARVCSMPIAFGPQGIRAIGYSNDDPGGYGERMVMNELLLLPVPEALPSEHAALTEPMAVGVHAVAKANLAPGDVPLVIGCGPVGLAVISALKLAGAGPIVASDFAPGRRALAEALGADCVVDPAQQSPFQSWSDLVTRAGGAPPGLLSFGMGGSTRRAVIFECVGVPGVLQHILRSAPRASRVVVVGVCMESDRIEPAVGITKEIELQFVLAYTPQEFASTLQHLASGALPSAPLITSKVGLEGVPSAFSALEQPGEQVKILVEPWRP
jgi:threonine dehydrogenase-like Zn-dependent dehydrogenase